MTPEKNTALGSSNESAIKRIVKGSGISLLGRIAHNGLRFFTQIITVWFLGPKGFGMYVLGMSIYKFGEVISSMGLHEGARRYISVYNGAKDLPRVKGILLQVFGFPFFCGLLVGGGVFLSADLVAVDIFGEPGLKPVLQYLAMAIPFGVSMTVIALATTGFQVTKYLVYILNIFQPIANLLGIILFCGIGLGLLGAIYAWIASVFLAALLAGVYILRIFPGLLSKNIDPVFETKQLLSFSLPLSFGPFVWFLLLWADTMILGYYRPSEEVGFYRVASQIALMLVLFVAALDTIFAPMVADSYNKKEIAKMKDLFQLTTRWSLSVALPLFVVVGIAGDKVLSIFGPEFSVGWLPLVILGFGQLVNASTGQGPSLLAMSGHQYLKLFEDLFSATLNIALNILFIPRWGIIGAAAATSISIVSANLIRTIQVYWVLGIQPYNWSYLKPILCGCLAALAGYLTRAWFPPVHFLFSLTISTTVIIGVYISLLWVMRLEETDYMIVKAIQKRLGY